MLERQLLARCPVEDRELMIATTTTGTPASEGRPLRG